MAASIGAHVSQTMSCSLRGSIYMAIQSHDAIGQSLLHISSRILNLVGLRGILSLINTDGWNVIHQTRLQVHVIHQTLPSPLY